MKCPYCKGTNLYIQRTSPMLAYGCRDCLKKAKLLEKKGLSKKEIREVLTK